jgi:2-oxo-3-hexenedioate decarboxylase
MIELDRIACEMLATLGTPAVLPRLTDQHPGYSLEDGYAVSHRIRDLRVARGERVVAHKVGGTNVRFAASISALTPTWSFVYNTTAYDFSSGFGTFAIGDYRQPRIEPEIAFRLSSMPQAGMDDEALIGCVDAVVHTYEIVHSPYSDWKVAPPDGVSAFGLHQALLIGPAYDITADRNDWIDRLRTLTVTLRGKDGETRTGVGADVYGSPLRVLGYLADDLAAHPERSPLQVGEIITTGTLTELMPLAPGQVWTTEFAGAPIPGLTVTIV